MIKKLLIVTVTIGYAMCGNLSFVPTAEASNVVCGQTGNLKYLRSVDTPQYLACVINPKNLPNVLIKYWKRIGNEIEEMTQIEKDAVDTTEAQAATDAENASIDNLQITKLEIFTALIKVINVRIPGNPITRQELVNQIKADR